MIICICKAVSDRHIRAAAADGVTSMRELTRELQVGTCCGKCVPEARAALSTAIAQCQRAVAVSGCRETGLQFVASGIHSAS